MAEQRIAEVEAQFFVNPESSNLRLISM